MMPIDYLQIIFMPIDYLQLIFMTIDYLQIIFMTEPTSRVIRILFNLQWSHQRLISLKSSVTLSFVALMLEQRLKKRRENKRMPTDRKPLNRLQRMLFKYGDQT